MTDREQNLKNEFDNYSDEALRNILFSSPGDYEEFALANAREKLQRRCEMLFSNSSGDFVPLYYIIKNTDFSEISDSLSLYIQKKAEFPLYKEAYEKISLLEYKQDNLFRLDIFKAGKNGDKLDVSGIAADDEKIDATFLTWNEWLSASIKKEQILQYGKERIAALLLVKMTANGFDENDTKKRLAEMESYVEPETEQEEEPEVGDDDEQTENIDSAFITAGIIAAKSNFRQNRNPQVRPWVRFFARMIDSMLFAVLFIFLLRSFPFQAIYLNKALKYIGISDIAWILIEAVLLSTLGVTPGKWLLKVKVRDIGGDKLKFKKSLQRSAFVWAAGNGLGIYLLNIIANLISYSKLKANQITLWDENLKTRVIHEKIEFWRYIVAAVILILPYAVAIIFIIQRKVFYF